LKTSYSTAGTLLNTRKSKRLKNGEKTGEKKSNDASQNGKEKIK
jgi:hypothetical protein